MKNCFLLIFLSCINLVIAQNNYVKDPTFNTFELPEGQYYIDGNEITKSIIQPDGKIVLALSSFSSVPTSQLIRLENNMLDTSFTSAGINGIVRDMVLQPDGKIIIVGDFTTYDNQSSKYIARLNSDGSLDTSFLVGTGFGTPAISNNKFAANVKLQADGKILVCGDLTSYNGTPKNYLIRLNTDGTIDDSFTMDSSWNSRVTTFAIQTDGKIIASHNGSVRRLNTDGSLDTSFDIYIGPNGLIGFPGPSTGIKVNTFVVQPDGKILVGGAFNQALGAVQKDLARLNSDGTLDTTFNFSGFNGFTENRNGVKTILLKDNGQILIGGDFDYAYQNAALSLLLLNSDGTVDDSFNGNMGYDPNNSRNSTVTDLLQHPDGKVLCTGKFHVYNRVAVSNIVKFSHNGEIDPTFHNICKGFDGGIHYLYETPDGKIMVTGDFHSYNGYTRYKMVRIFPNGDIDESFEVRADVFTHDNYFIRDVKFQPDGKILVASEGKFFSSQTGGTILGGSLIRLNSDGTLDTSFANPESGNYGLGGTCHSIIVEDDGKIIAGGALTSFNGQTVEKIIRFNSDGTLDTTIDYEVPFTYIHLVQKTSDNKLLVSGSNGSLNSRTISRLNSNGQIDDTFQVDASLVVTSFRVLESGKILVTTDIPAGHLLTLLNADGSTDTSFNFTGYNIINVAYQNALDFQSNGKIIKSVPAHINSAFMQRYNADGTLDTNFSVGTGFTYGVGNFSQFNTSRVTSILTLEDGRILVGGNYRLFNDIPERSLIRLKEDNAVYLDDIITDNDSGLCEAVVNYNFDDFGEDVQVVQTSGLSSGSVFPIGLTFNSFEITVGGQVFTRTFYVMVKDAEAPVLNVSDIEIDLNGADAVSITSEDIDDGTFDNCGDFILTLSQDIFTQTGEYQVTVTATDNANNSSETVITVTVADSSLGIQKNNLGDIILYPVPVKNYLYFSSPENVNVESITVYDNLGRIVLTKFGNTNTIDLSDAPFGMMFVVIKTENTAYRKKIFRN